MEANARFSANKQRYIKDKALCAKHPSYSSGILADYYDIMWKSFLTTLKSDSGAIYDESPEDYKERRCKEKHAILLAVILEELRVTRIL